MLATGGRPRLSLCSSDMPGVLTLRDAEDSVRLRDAMERDGGLVIVGAGFIGIEVAAVARRRGLPVTVIDKAPQVLGRALPEDVTAAIAERHRREGVDIRLSSSVAAVRPGADVRVAEVVLADGSTLPCRTLLLAIGMAPETGLADATGLDLNDGMVTNSWLRTSAPAILAAGDAVRFRSPLFDRTLPLGGWRNAEDHAAVIVDRLSGGNASRTIKGGGIAGVATVAAAGVEVAQEALAEAQDAAQDAALPRVPYLDTLRWVFIAAALAGIAVAIYARIDERKAGTAVIAVIVAGLIARPWARTALRCGDRVHSGWLTAVVRQRISFHVARIHSTHAIPCSKRKYPQPSP